MEPQLSQSEAAEAVAPSARSDTHLGGPNAGAANGSSTTIPHTTSVNSISSFADKPTPEQIQTLVNRRTVYEAEPKAEGAAGPAKHTIRLVPLMDHAHSSAAHPKTVVRKLKSDGIVQLGRVDSSEDKCRPVVYLSKVVSRKHAELVLENGSWFLKDVGSSSGTFVNNNRLSPAGVPSALHGIGTGDVLRFGVDFRGGAEPHYRAIRVRVEIDGVSTRAPDEYQRLQMQKLVSMAPNASTDGEIDTCAICLEPLLATSSLFVSPCFHMWHYRCIRLSLVAKYPYFDCPLCRKTFDLEELSDDDCDGIDEASEVE